MLAGISRRDSICSISFVAVPRATPLARLNDTVTDGNSPVWLTCSGVVPAWELITPRSGVIEFNPATEDEPELPDDPPDLK